MGGWVRGREGGVGRDSGNYTALFRAGKATKNSQKASIPHHKAIGDVYSWQFHWCHYHIRDFTGSAKCPSEKQIPSTLASGDDTYCVLECSYNLVQ